MIAYIKMEYHISCSRKFFEFMPNGYEHGGVNIFVITGLNSALKYIEKGKSPKYRRKPKIT